MALFDGVAGDPIKAFALVRSMTCETKAMLWRGSGVVSGWRLLISADRALPPSFVQDSLRGAMARMLGRFESPGCCPVSRSGWTRNRKAYGPDCSGAGTSTRWRKRAEQRAVRREVDAYLAGSASARRIAS